MVVAGSPELKVEGRMLWNDRRARVKLILPCRGMVEYDMPGGRIVRDEKGQVPAARWVVRSQGARKVGVATDVLSDFDATPDELRVTLARASHYAARYNQDIWRPAVDCGELKFKLCLFDENAAPDQMTDSLLFAPTAIVAPATPGSLSRSGSFGNLTPVSARLLTIEQYAPDALRVRVQNRARGSVNPILTLGESRIPLGKLGPEQIRTITFRKHRNRAAWTIVRP
jgi:alpha-mannosidase